MFPGKIFENGWLRTAASEITARDVIQFLTIKIFLVFLYNVTFNV